MVELIIEVEEQADEIRALRADLEARDVPDIDAIWAEIEYRVEEAAADAARQVIRDELVVSVDLI
jgi:predicted dinucleotide-utilizing enzyme